MKPFFDTIDVSRKKIFDKKMKSDKQGFRFATPEIVARYRAKRLKCNRIADISCGIGGQTIFFAMECDHVYAIEIDPEKIAYAKENCNRFGLDNVTFICGDALDPEVINSLPELDTVFCDPARPPGEKERDINNLSPPIADVLEAYKDKTSSIVFEAPPQLTPGRIPFECEKEYLSLNGQLNRLDLYFGSLNEHERSAVALPLNVKLTPDEKCAELKSSDMPDYQENYAYEPEPSVVRAGLLCEFADVIRKENAAVSVLQVDKKRTLITSDKLITHPFAKNRYIILNTMELEPETLNRMLLKENAEKVILRGGMSPEDYWPLRKKIENGLHGDSTIHLFIKREKAIVCKLVE